VRDKPVLTLQPSRRLSHVHFHFHHLQLIVKETLRTHVVTYACIAETY